MTEPKALRILHLGKFYPPVRGGIENFSHDLARAQLKAGMHPFVLAHRTGSFQSTRIETVEGIPVCRAATLAHLVYAPLSPGYALLLEKIVADFNPDVIHAHLPNPSAFWLLFGRIRKPIVLHWHADVVPSKIDRRLAMAYRAYRPFERHLLRASSAIIATSGPYLESSLPLREFRRKSHVIPLGLDTSRLHLPSSGATDSIRELLPKKFLLLSAGRFSYYKGFDQLIDVVRDLPGVFLVIAGDGPLRAPLTRKVRQMALADRVLLPGEVSDRLLHALMASCDAFCLPSVERTEAFGMTLLEAMAFGKPLISTSIEGSGTGWVNVDGKTGLVVPPRNRAAMRAAIEALMSDPERRHEMGLESEARLGESFQIDRVASQVLRLYRSTLHTPPDKG